MRSKIKVDDKWYRPVPWLVDGECDGCPFARKPTACPNTGKGCCDSGGEFDGYILIPHTKEGMAEYIAKKLSPSEDND